MILIKYIYLKKRFLYFKVLNRNIYFLQEQYKSLYDSLKLYVETDSVYSNFEPLNNGLVNPAFENNKDDINVYANS